MTTIVLAHWYEGRPPGSELDVDDDQLRQLRRDGRVASVVEQSPADPAPAAAEPLESSDAEVPEAVSLEEELPAKVGRRRR